MQSQRPASLVAAGGAPVDHNGVCCCCGAVEFRPGLEDVPVAQSAICHIDGKVGSLLYRGYAIEDLVRHSNFLETTHLLIWGELPPLKELQAFEHDVYTHRRIKFRIRDVMKCFPESGHPMDALQASAAALGLFYSRRVLDNPLYIRQAVVRLVAKIPTMVAAFQLIRKGLDPIRPRDDLSYAANFLYMLNEKEPEPLAARVLDACLILHAEHSLNASTFSARVTASTLTDPYAVVASAVGTLAGPLHGGANEDVLDMLAEIGSPDQVEPFLDQCLVRKRRIAGFGHRVYRVKDPRAKILQELAEKLFACYGSDATYDLARLLEKKVEERLAEKDVYANVDFYSGLVYRRLGIPTDLFTPVFAIARVAGWLAHWKEQLSTNRIFRPSQIYTGVAPRSWQLRRERGMTSE